MPLMKSSTYCPAGTIVGADFDVGVLVNSTPVEVRMSDARIPATVWVAPVAGDTVTVEYRSSDAGPWAAWPKGAVTAYADDALISPLFAVRFTRSAGSGTTSAFGVAQ